MVVIMGDALSAIQAANLAAMASNLVALPGGTFMMGAEEPFLNAGPVHEVTVSAFRMGKYDVTNGECADFVNQLGPNRFALLGVHHRTGVQKLLALGDEDGAVRSAVKNCGYLSRLRFGDIVQVGGMKVFADSLKVVEMRDHNPLLFFHEPRQPAFMSHDCAFVFAAVNGGSLPTEAQWEFAARVITPGKDALRVVATASGRLMVGGVKQAQYGENVTADVDDPRFAPLQNGLHQMAGNARRWMLDYWSESYSGTNHRDPVNTLRGMFKVVRGAAYDDADAAHLHAAYRNPADPDCPYNRGFGMRFVAPVS